MTLTDAGPLVALINRNDPHHAACLVASKGLTRGSMLTTWSCFTEAMYLTGRAGGHPAQAALWQMRAGGRLAIHDLTAAEADRMAVLMDRYKNVPMDLADASLVAVAESRSLTQIFTVDGDFYVYRLADGSALQVIR
jgi:predicted nucleic acid-binding protein